MTNKSGPRKHTAAPLLCLLLAIGATSADAQISDATRRAARATVQPGVSAVSPPASQLAPPATSGVIRMEKAFDEPELVVAPARLPIAPPVVEVVIPVAMPAALPNAMPVQLPLQMGIPRAAPVSAAMAGKWEVQVADVNLSNTFHRWGGVAGYRVKWDAARHVLIDAPGELNGVFEDALERVLASPGIRNSDYPLEVCFYPNTPPLARITRRGEQVKDCK
jgi:hypothetical protein